ncbi:hypothetical protein Trydic_g9674 [Trypoxylus dichotomus]
MSADLDVTASEQLRLASRGYKILTKLGHGTYATVYLVEFKNPRTNKEMKLACKSMDTSRMAKEFVTKFLPRELDILSRINHPHIIQVQNIFQRRQKFYVFMRYAENGDLLDFVIKKGALSEPQARVWFRQIALAVHYLHEMGVAHRDLKCENIFITAHYNIRLADFGFARYAIDDHGKTITSDTFCGSISYAAPEIIRGLTYYPKHADVWSLGVILYVILNRAMPFDDANVKVLYDQQMCRKWRFRPKVVNTLSKECKTLVGRLLEPNISSRWDIVKVVNSDWIAMDERLRMLTPSEEAALKQAKAERKKLTGSRESSKLSFTKAESGLVYPTIEVENVSSKIWHDKCDSVQEIKAYRDESKAKGSIPGLESNTLKDT